MGKKELRSCLMLLLAAAIWGFAFVAQRVGIEYVPSFAFNGIRFALGTLAMLPLMALYGRKAPKPAKTANALPRGLIMGLVLFVASSLQQIGLIYTSAGKAAFITGMYIVIVPLLGILLGHRIHPLSWVGVVISAAGLYLISVTGGFAVSRGDLYEVSGAFCWAVHILLIDRFTRQADALKLSVIQYATCSVLSLAVSAVFEKVQLSGVLNAAVPILYGGIFSVAIAYTLQMLGQRNASPSHSAIILSMEAVFATLGGFLILNENLGLRAYCGCALMIAAILLSQYPIIHGEKKRSAETVKT
ncbi:MAG: DMT family transporter [Clostridia bacterium]|nr:DMT family transporter [Clostridia bacterium]MDR3645890.1 DMT family transporter [Clostridia bacterium]